MKVRLIALMLVCLLLSACGSAEQPTASNQPSDGTVVTVGSFQIWLPDNTWRASSAGFGTIELKKDNHYYNGDPTIKIFIDDHNLEDSLAFAGGMFPALPDSDFELKIGDYTCVGNRTELKGKQSTAILDRVFFPISDKQTLRFQIFTKNGDVEGVQKDDPEVQRILQNVIELNGYDSVKDIREMGDENGIADSGRCEDTTWTLDTNGVLHIGGSAEMASRMNAADYPWAKYKHDVTEVVFDTDVTRISSLAFKEFSALRRVELPSSVKKLYIGCFESCPALEQITLPEGLEEVEYFVFSGCSSLKEITIPGSLKHVDNYAFDSCESLEIARVSSGVESFGYDVFSQCPSLKTVYLPKSLKLIDLYSFFQTGLQDVYYEGSEADFREIDIKDNNDDLLNAEMHWNAVP